jgi:hypothetical protein
MTRMITDLERIKLKRDKEQLERTKQLIEQAKKQYNDIKGAA